MDVAGDEAARGSAESIRHGDHEAFLHRHYVGEIRMLLQRMHDRPLGRSRIAEQMGDALVLEQCKERRAPVVQVPEGADPIDLADNMKKYGGFIPGVRPGKKTAEYIDRVLTRITLPGAIFLALISVLPDFLIRWFNVPFYFGGTSLLIVVGVALDTVRQIVRSGAEVLVAGNAVFGSGDPRSNAQKMLKAAMEATLQKV